MKKGGPVEHTSLQEGILEPAECQQVLLLCHHRRAAYRANPIWSPGDSGAEAHRCVWRYSCVSPSSAVSLWLRVALVGKMQAQTKIALMTQVLVCRTDGWVAALRHAAAMLVTLAQNELLIVLCVWPRRSCRIVRAIAPSFSVVRFAALSLRRLFLLDAST